VSLIEASAGILGLLLAAVALGERIERGSQVLALGADNYCCECSALEKAREAESVPSPWGVASNGGAADRTERWPRYKRMGVERGQQQYKG